MLLIFFVDLVILLQDLSDSSNASEVRSVARSESPTVISRFGNQIISADSFESVINGLKFIKMFQRCQDILCDRALKGRVFRLSHA